MLSGLCVLVVEDDPLIAMVICDCDLLGFCFYLLSPSSQQPAASCPIFTMIYGTLRAMLRACVVCALSIY